MTLPQQTVFLDTSIQIRRTLAALEEVSRIELQLTLPTIQAVTSTYVWMEYQRTVIADYACVQQLMGLYDNWGALFRHLLDGSRAFRPRSAVRCTQILGKIYEESDQDVAMARDILSGQITDGLRRQFWTNVDRLPDLIACDLVTTGITLQLDASYTVANTCRKATAACHLPDFLFQQQARIRTLADYLAAHPHAIKQQERIERLFANVLTDPRAALGQSACWPLGDVIIALQVPMDALVWTLDRDFEPLVLALGLHLYSDTGV